MVENTTRRGVDVRIRVLGLPQKTLATVSHVIESKITPFHVQ